VQRAAGDALAGTLNEQLNPSALRPALLAAKAALDALMQHISSAAAAISMINLMTWSLPRAAQYRGFDGCLYHQSPVIRRWRIGPVFA
jgi:hypothetical protein